MDAVNVGAIGVGNCTASRVQGVAHYTRLGAPSVGLTRRVDGIGEGSRERIEARGRATVAGVAEHLRASSTHVLINFLPAGSQCASELYAEAARQLAESAALAELEALLPPPRQARGSSGLGPS